ncbi:MAG: Bug family tripartite tricarboxylate transporter substrate binding protein [Rhabdaerophilum sp.]
MESRFPLSRRLFLSGSTALAAPALLGRSAAAQGQYPQKPINLIVTFAAGGGVDTVSRLFAEALGTGLSGRMVVENRGGGGTMIGTQAVTGADPDGYMLLSAPTTMVINPAVKASMPYDWQKDLVPIGLMAKLPFVAVTRPNSPLQSIKDILSLSQSKPEPLSYASGGTGTVAHLAGELFALRTGAKMQHVPYRGEGPAVIDVQGGALDLTFATLAAVAGQIDGKQLRALGVTTSERADLVPDIPTIQEQGVTPFDVSAWITLMAPARAPMPVVTRLKAALAEALSDRSLRDRLGKIGAIAAPQNFDTPGFMRREAATWAQVIRDAKLSF